jgi:hypothetical protein
VKSGKSFWVIGMIYPLKHLFKFGTFTKTVQFSHSFDLVSKCKVKTVFPCL